MASRALQCAAPCWAGRWHRRPAGGKLATGAGTVSWAAEPACQSGCMGLGGVRGSTAIAIQLTSSPCKNLSSRLVTARLQLDLPFPGSPNNTSQSNLLSEQFSREICMHGLNAGAGYRLGANNQKKPTNVGWRFVLVWLWSLATGQCWSSH